MRVLVTGATGFIGSHVVPRLLAAGHAVRALVRPTSDTAGLPPEVEVVRGELGAAAPACAGIDGLVHLAGISGSLLRAGDPGRELRKVNVEDAGALFRAAAAAGARRGVLVTSMWSVLRPQLADTSPYVRSRVDSEAVVLAAGGSLETAILCPTFVVGAGDRGPNFPGAIVRAFARGWLPVAPPGGATWIAARDVAAAVLAALERGEHGRRYLLGAEHLSYRDLGAAAARLGGVAPPRWTLPWSLATYGGQAADVALRVFGRRSPIPFGVGVELLCLRAAIDCTDTWKALAAPEAPVLEAVAEAVAWFAAR